MKQALATFGAGCFWHVEEMFMKLPGVIETAVGFMGGTAENPSYTLVCSGNTGHAEVVQVTYDPEKISYDDLLKVFWENHDPTEVNRQGPDIGEQYRSIIFYHSPAQKEAAEKSKDKIAKKHDKPIATKIVPAEEFYKAEEYHQKYFEKQNADLH